LTELPSICGGAVEDAPGAKDYSTWIGSLIEYVEAVQSGFIAIAVDFENNS
jgi:hypothetical protein